MCQEFFNNIDDEKEEKSNEIDEKKEEELIGIVYRVP